MRKLQGIVVGGLLACALFWGQVVSPLWGQQKTEPGRPSAPAEEQEKALDARYAEAYLAAMEATLARYEKTNRIAPNTIRPTIIQGLQESVRKARERVQFAQSDTIGGSKIYVSSAEADLRLAEEGLRRAKRPIPGPRSRSALARSRG